MKTAIKIFLILGMIVGATFSLICLFGILIVPFPLNLLYIILAIYGLVPFTIDLVARKKLEKASSKNELTVISILVLLFGGLIAGILMLVASEEDLIGYKTKNLYEEHHQKETLNQSLSIDNLESELNKLKKLHDNGTLTDEEYEEARKKIINKNL